ncbi:MAG: septum formation inhibitor Maf [Bacteroidia bacterium]|nr:septum formation inhibitor Maf [Bacteroidia bacterium]
MKFALINYLFALFCLTLLTACNNGSAAKEPLENPTKKELDLRPATVLSEDFKSYWYSDQAELTSYKLEQARYGELRDGHAVLIYVTEGFLTGKQVKTDSPNSESISILKLNSTKNYSTGIYPYSVMQSTFYPVANNQHAIKVSSSMQEWCGHVYSQINNRDQFEVILHSYFEGEADQEFKLNKSYLENEIWTQLRIDPTTLPQGEIDIIPSLEYLRYRHSQVKPYKATGRLETGKYELYYPELERSLIINFNPEFPYEIESWEETFSSGYGPSAQKLTTKATKLKQLNTPYWRQNRNVNEVLQDSLMIR